MWLSKQKPPRTKRVCQFCGGCFGLTRPNFPYCSTYCAAWEENQKITPRESSPDPHGDFIAALRYP